MLKKITIFTALCCIPAIIYGQKAKKGNPFSFEASYLGDAYGNAAGGLKTGGGYMGMANLKLGINTGRAGWWKGGSFFINGASIHGKSLSENFLGDFQTASNIDGGEHVYMHELWFRQRLGRVSLTLGLQDLNVDYMVSENGGEFINSSFGVPPVISGNVPVPIFPLTGLGASVRWDIDERFILQAAVFDGCQKPFGHNPYNLYWNFSKDDGILAMTEFHAKANLGEKAGVYKLGTYYHSGLNEPDEENQTKSAVFNNNYGIYLLGDQSVFECDNNRLDIFAQVAVAPKSKNETNYYIGLGTNLFGIFSKEQCDAVGLAAAHAGLHTVSHRHETSLELYYKYQLNDNIAIQPDVQYIINPSGTNTKLPNALACILRLHINF